MTQRKFRGTRRFIEGTLKLADRSRRVTRRSVSLGLLGSVIAGKALADSTITNLPAASALSNSDLFIVTQGGASKKATGAQVGALAPATGGGSDPYDFDSKAQATAATIAGTVNYIRIAGYTNPGDGGASMYRRVTAQPGHALWIHSTDGTYWEWCGDAGGMKILVPEMAGAVGDAAWSEGTASSWTGTDNTVALQNCIDAHMYFGLADRVSFRGFTRTAVNLTGCYRTTTSLQLGYGDAFRTCRLEGPGRAIGAGYAPLILCDFTNAPAVCVNGGRDTMITGISFWGRLWDWINNNNMGLVGGALNDDSIAANWVGTASGGPTMSAAADTQYTQYCGICIDPYSGPIPSPAYPNFTRPSYAGGGTMYSTVGLTTNTGNQTPSSNTFMRNCGFHGFVVAVACQTSNWDSNGDFTRTDNCVFENNKVCIGVGNTQSREVASQGCSFANAYVIWDGNTYGHQAGKIGGPQLGCDGSGCMNVVNIGSTSISAPFSLVTFYIEAGYKIGLINAGSGSETSIGFYDCQFDFSAQNPSYTRGIPLVMLDGGNQAIGLRFVGGVMTNYWSVFTTSYMSPDITFDGTRFQCQVLRYGTGGPVGSGNGAAYKCLASNATCQGIIMARWNNLNERQAKQRVAFEQTNVDTVASFYSNWSGPRQRYAARPQCASYLADRLCASGQPDDDGVINPQVRWITTLDKGSLGTPTNANSGGKLVLTFTMPAGNTPATIFQNGPTNGDCIWDDSTGTVWWVRSVSAASPPVITAVQQNNYKTVGGVAQAITPIAFTAGTYFWILVSRFYTPTTYTVGNFSTTAATITSVGAPQGGNSWVTTDIKVGDLIWNDDWRSNQFSAVNGTLTAVTAAQLTMSGNANIAGTAVPLRLFVRTAPANSAVN